MPNIINLATEDKQDTIVSNIADVKTTVNTVNTNVNANKTTLGTINTNVGTISTNLGAPTSIANNATSANAHAKLNHINNTLANINTNVNGVNYFNATQEINGEVYSGSASELISGINQLTGKFILHGFAISNTSTTSDYVLVLEIDDVKKKFNIRYLSGISFDMLIVKKSLKLYAESSNGASGLLSSIKNYYVF